MWDLFHLNNFEVRFAPRRLEHGAKVFASLKENGAVGGDLDVFGSDDLEVCPREAARHHGGHEVL